MKNYYWKIISLVILTSTYYTIVSGDSGSTGLSIQCDYWPPYTFPQVDDNTTLLEKPLGFCPDVLNNVFKQMNVKPNSTRFNSWARVTMNLKNGTADAVYMGKKTKQRQQYALYPDEHIITGGFSLYIHKDNLGKLKFTSYDDLKNYRVGVCYRFAYPESFLEFGKKHKILRRVKQTRQNINKLLLKRVDYIVMDRNVANYYIKQNNAEDKILLLKKPLSTHKYYVMFSKKTVKPEFVKKFSNALKAFKKSEEFAKILEKYGFISQTNQPQTAVKSNSGKE